MEVSIYRRLQLGLLAVVIAVAGLALATASTATAGETGWYVGTGTQYFNYGNGVELERSVDAWVAADGRYRVVVESPDGAAEEFTFDGTDALMFVTPPGMKNPSSVVERDSDYLWTLDGHPVAASADARPEEMSAPSERHAASGLATLVEHEGTKGASYRLELTWSPLEANDQLLEPSPGAESMLASRTPEDKDEQPPSDPATRAVNSNSQTFYDNFYTQGACVFGKNYRDAEDSYLRAYSAVRGDCDQIGVSLFHGSQKQGGAGFCEPHGILASGTHASYKNYSLYTAWDTPTCTAHAGWWESLLVVNYQGPTTVPYND